MSLIKKPSELQAKKAIAVLLYGQPGIGKTTLATSAPRPVVFDFDGGITRVNGAHQAPTVQITQWEDCTAALKEVGDDFDSIIIDTAGKMLSFMDNFIKRHPSEYPKMWNDNTGLSLKGYGARKMMFINFLLDVQKMGKNLIFIAHEKEEKRGVNTIIRPEIGGSSANDLMKELDLVGYMEAKGVRRTISFNPCESFYAKNTCNLPALIEIPTLIDAQGNIITKDAKGAPLSNNLLTLIIQQFGAMQNQNIEKTAEYEQIIAIIDEKIGYIEDAKTANEVVEEIMGMQHVYNSQFVASNKVAAKAKALGLTFNKIKKIYE